MKIFGLLCEKTWNYRSQSVSRLYNMIASIPFKLNVVKSIMKYILLTILEEE